MQAVLFVFLMAIFTIATAYSFAFLGMAIAGATGVIENLPEWTWASILVCLILMTWRGLRYSPD